MRILHTADWHYGMRHYGLPQREADMYKAGDFVVKRAIELKVDAVVLAGDIFDTPKPSAFTVQVLADQVRRLHDAGIEVLGIDGNHDMVDGNWLKVCNVTPVTSDRPIVIKGISFLGINSMRPSVFKQRLETICTDQFAPVDVLIIHQAVAEMAGFMTQDLTALEIATTLNKRKLGIKLVLMGDIHNYAEMVVGGIRFIYSGSIETTAVNDVPTKTFSLIDIEPGKVPITSYEPIPIRPIYQLQLSTEADLDNLVRDMEKYKDGLVIISHEWKDRELGKRAEALLEGKPFLYRLRPAAKLVTENLAVQLNRDSFERKNSLVQLKEAITAFFDEKSEQYELITQMLNAPATVEGIVKQYMASKGLKV